MPASRSMASTLMCPRLRTRPATRRQGSRGSFARHAATYVLRCSSRFSLVCSAVPTRRRRCARLVRMGLGSPRRRASRCSPSPACRPSSLSVHGQLEVPVYGPCGPRLGVELALDRLCERRAGRTVLEVRRLLHVAPAAQYESFGRIHVTCSLVAVGRCSSGRYTPTGWVSACSMIHRLPRGHARASPTPGVGEAPRGTDASSQGSSDPRSPRPPLRPGGRSSLDAAPRQHCRGHDARGDLVP